MNYCIFLAPVIISFIHWDCQRSLSKGPSRLKPGSQHTVTELLYAVIVGFNLYQSLSGL